MARRLFYAQEWKGKRAWLKGETAEHLRRVLRAERGQVYELSDGERVWLGRIDGFGKELVEFTLLEEAPAARAPAPVHLLAALIKFDHFEWMIEKATELGVERITPIAAIRSDKGLAPAAAKRHLRWERIAREAGQQSRRVRPPKIDPLTGWSEALSPSAPVKLILDEDSDAAPVLHVLEHGRGPLALLCGPEGGWDPREREEALQAGWKRVSLGPMILRAETAALAAVAVAVAAQAWRPQD
ncbi:MAG: RsmE family RNA methyltransferase [Bryobacteraceae bacterium]